jgi:hypothetical protein
MLKRIAKILKLPVAYCYAESDELAQWGVLFVQLKKSERRKILKKLSNIPKKSLSIL